MSAQSRSLSTSVSQQLKSLSNFIALPAAIILLIAFVLPWLTVLNDKATLDDVTGYQLATGVDSQTIKEQAGDAFNSDASLYLLLLPLGAVASLAVVGMRLVLHKSADWAVGTYAAAGVLGLGAHLFKYLQMQIALTDAQTTSDSLVKFSFNTAWWASLAASFVLLIAAYVAYRSESQIRERPNVMRVTYGVRTNILQIGIIAVMLALWLLFIIGSPETFLNTQIYRALMTSIPYWGIIALPLTMVVIAGEIDLSFPSTMAVGMVAFFEVYTRQDSLGLALAGALVAGFVVGLLNGIIIVKLGIPSLIATIGTQFFWRGLVEVIREGQGESMVFTRDSTLRNTLVNKVGDYFPAQVIWMLLVAVVVWIILNRHKFGAHVYLIGDNEGSARLMGVNVGLTRIMLFALVGLAAAFAGVIQSIDNWYFWPNMGEGYLMQTLAAVFLGGTSVYGGTGTVLGTFIACFIIGAIQPGIVAVGLTGYYTKLIYGMIITLSVSMHTLMRRRME